MNTPSVTKAIRAMEQPVFTTREIALVSGRSLSAAGQSLKRLAKQEIVVRVKRGLWADVGDPRFSPFLLIGHLLPSHRAYLSFLSALHLHGMISQIPQVITIASTVHSRTVRTPAGIFQIHQIAPSFFTGFDWYRGTGEFLIAEPEKALADCLYISGRKGKKYGFFPEITFPKNFRKAKVRDWLGKISDRRLRKNALDKLERLLRSGG